MLNYTSIPMALDIISTWIPNEFFIITVFMVNSEWLHNNGTLKVLVQFIVKKDIFCFVRKCLRRCVVSDAVLFFRSGLWVRRRWDYGLIFQGSGKLRVRTWRSPRLNGSQLEWRLIFRRKEPLSMLIYTNWGAWNTNQIHQLWFRFGEHLWIVCFLFHKTKHD